MKFVIIGLFCLSVFNSPLSAQIIYIDIPDTVLLRPPIPLSSGGGENSYDFDINNDSSIDLTFLLSVNKYYLPEWNQYQIIITERMGSNGTLYFMNVSDNCMKELNQYDTIDINQYWHHNSIISGQNYYIGSKNKEMICNSSNSNKYCGIMLFNNGNYFYGWVRLSWTGSYVKVHDFAYNATPDELILAGDTVLNEINEINQNNPFTISQYHGKLEITSQILNHKIDKVRLIGISGQCIRDLEINKFKASINISNIQKGFYIVQIVQSNNIFVQKLFISNY